jgi:benzoate-CoA ligase
MKGLQVPNTFNAATAFVDENVRRGRGRKTALYYDDKTYTYDDVLTMVNKTGNVLKELGVEREQRILMIMLDSSEFVATFWGAMKIGAVPVPVNTLLKAADYEYFLNDSRAKVLVVHEALLAEIEKIQGQLKHLRYTVVVGSAKENQISFHERCDGASEQLDAAETSKDDVAFWLYSSGSTGFPKGAVHLHHDMVYCAEYYAKGILGINEQDITFSAAKLFFAYGLGNNLYFPFWVGASAVLYPGRPLPEKMFEVLQKYRPTLFYGVPTLYAAMLQVAEQEALKMEDPNINEPQSSIPSTTLRTDLDLRSVRFCISAGEALPAEIYRRWKDRFKRDILDGIGSTEVLHIFLSNLPGKIKPGSSGMPVPGYEAKIVDEAGIEVPVGEIGNLLIKGDSTAAYYWNNHEKTKQTILGEWIRTGDKYYRDEDGYYWYCGRSDDMLKVGGIWVSPIEVESTLIEHPAVLESAVIGDVDEENLVKPRAFVVLKAGYAPSSELAEELKTFVKNKIAPYKYPRWIEFVKELPKTATGKIQRFKLRASRNFKEYRY